MPRFNAARSSQTSRAPRALNEVYLETFYLHEKLNLCAWILSQMCKRYVIEKRRRDVLGIFETGFPGEKF